ncbi:MAG: CbiX/SirB N-terminal domain-containing protein [Microthrixaceae bacterium]
MASPRVTVLVAHGSRNPRSQEAHAALVDEVAVQSGRTTVAAYLEMAEPGIPDAIDAAVASGAAEVVVVPCFLHPGNHVLVDIPAVVDEARERHAEVPITLTAHLGSSAALVPVLAELADNAS